VTCLFFDRNVGTAVPRALKQLKLPVRVENHESHFNKEAPDDEWLAAVGSREWFVIGHDHMLHRRANELQAIRQYSVGVFYLWGANATRWEKMRVFARAYDRIVAAAEGTPRPFVIRVLKNGRLIPVRIP
jgi:PIN like domain